MSQQNAANNIEELAENAILSRKSLPAIWQNTRWLLLGFTMKELADALSCSEGHISKIESDNRVPSPKLIVKFADLKKAKRPNVRFLSEDEICQFPGDNHTDIAIKSNGIEYYGESDETGELNHQFIYDENSQRVEIKKD